MMISVVRKRPYNVRRHRQQIAMTERVIDWLNALVEDASATYAGPDYTFESLLQSTFNHYQALRQTQFGGEAR